MTEKERLGFVDMSSRHAVALRLGDAEQPIAAALEPWCRGYGLSPSGSDPLQLVLRLEQRVVDGRSRILRARIGDAIDAELVRP